MYNTTQQKYFKDTRLMWTPFYYRQFSLTPALTFSLNLTCLITNTFYVTLRVCINEAWLYVTSFSWEANGILQVFKQQILNYEDDQIYDLKFCRKFVEEQKAGYSSLQSQVFKDKQAVYW